jgi:hypothetical protein
MRTPRSRYLAAASKQMPNAIITTPMTPHRPRPVMNEPPISPPPWPRKMPADDDQQKTETARYAAEHQHHLSSDRDRSTARR